MNSLIDVALANYRATLLAMFAVICVGIFARSSISVEAEPHVAVPVFFVTVIHEGISPEDAERLLVKPMEFELRALEGIKEVRSLASEGLVKLQVEFEVETEQNAALLDVREAIDRARPEMPATAEEPIIVEGTGSDLPVLVVNIMGPNVPEKMLHDIARLVEDELKAVPGVLLSSLEGEREEVVEAVISPTKLEAYNISIEQLASTVLKNNRFIPAGAIDQRSGRFSIRVPSVIESVADLYDLPVKTTAQTVLTLGDVANIRRTFKDRTNYIHINGQPGISISISKRAKANTIETIEAVKAVIQRLKPNIPRSVAIVYTFDQSLFASQQIRELEGNIVTALAIVMVLVVAAMGLRAGLLVIVGIPVSLLFALTLIFWMGYTFNFMVMFGMLLSLGMLIDGAIVVTEYAEQKMLMGEPSDVAYSLAAKRMFWPVVASTATTLAAFLPLVLWPGVIGDLMSYLPITVFAVLVGSLLFALIFCPTLGSLIGKAKFVKRSRLIELQCLENGDPTTLNNFTGWYARLLRFALHHSIMTVILVLICIISSFMVYGKYGRGVIFFSDTEPNVAYVNVKSRGNLSIDESRALVDEVEQKILQVADIKSINTTIQTPGTDALNLDRIGSMTIILHDFGERPRGSREILEEIRHITRSISAVSIEVQERPQGPAAGKPISVQFASKERALLDPAVKHFRDYIDQLPGVRDVSDTRSLPGLEWEILVDRARASLYGVDVTHIGNTVQLVTNGMKVGEYRPNDANEPVDIRIRYPKTDRGLLSLDKLRVSTPSGLVPMSNFVRRHPVPNVDTNERINGYPIETVSANVSKDVLASDVVKSLKTWVDGQEWDPQVAITFRGENEDQEEAAGFVVFAFVLSVLLMFMLLITQFNSFYQSSLVLFAVVLSTAGVFLGLVLTDSTYSVVLTSVGVMALAGIVVNNNIILIDSYNRLCRELPKLDLISLAVRTGAKRLRPVLLTTLTTVVGLLPLANDLSVDFINREIIQGGRISSYWVPLAQAIVSGLIFATVLTLITTPVLLLLPHQMRSFLRRVNLIVFQKHSPQKESIMGI